MRGVINFHPLASMSGLSSSMHSSNMLLTGMYISDAATTLHIIKLKNTGEEIISSATIQLNGPAQTFFDAANFDSPSNFNNKTATRSFTIPNGH